MTTTPETANVPRGTVFIIEDLLMNRTFLISYSHSKGFGRFYNYREDGAAPSVENIESMEKKIAKQNGFDAVVTIAVSELRDTQ